MYSTYLKERIGANDMSAFAHVDDDPDVEILTDPADYCWFDPIEDVAVAPKISWTDADKRQFLADYVRRHQIPPIEWVDVEWPPEGRLSEPGSLAESHRDGCDAHAEYGEPVFNCLACEEATEPTVESNAVWLYTARFTVYAVVLGPPNSRAFELGWTVETVAAVEQDPRTLRIKPLRR